MHGYLYFILHANLQGFQGFPFRIHAFFIKFPKIAEFYRQICDSELLVTIKQFFSPHLIVHRVDYGFVPFSTVNFCCVVI